MKISDVGHVIWLSGSLLLCACTQRTDSNYEVLAKQNLSCPDGAHVEYAPWGGKPTGMIARCKLNHGPYLVATEGRLHLKGESRMGKDYGEVTVLDKADPAPPQEQKP